MCNHVYTADYDARPEGMGQRCPYPALFAGLSGADAVLPVDAAGACIFHSADAAWKRKNDFAGRFLRLPEVLDARDPQEHYDFAEFVFVGAHAGGADGDEPRLRIAGVTFGRRAYFISARFLDPVQVEEVEFPWGAEFGGAEFTGELKVARTRMNGAGFDGARFARAWFTEVEFLSYAMFSRAHFTGAAAGGLSVRFSEVRFVGLADFTGAVFEPRDESTAAFERVRFEDFADFRDARFRCHASFSQATFADIADFIDTSFEVVGSSARYVGAAAEFVGLRVPATGVLTFQSTDPARKLFAHDVEMTFDGEPEGTVRFENADLSRFLPSSRAALLELSRRGRVEIGAGCIKYRLQTEPRTVPVTQGNGALVVELCQTFAHYFTAHHGLNLGFEILSREAERITFFYFTDEDLTEAEFLARLAWTGRDLWNLLTPGHREALAALPPPGPADAPARESAAINAVDGLSALMGTFFRVGVRIAAGRWQAQDTRALLGAIRFGDSDTDAELRAAALHRTLAERYTGAMLAELSQRQNALLPPMAPAGPEVRILFLTASAPGSSRDLEKELERIETDLRLARERGRLTLTQVWAASVDRLMQALLDEAPTFVHFAGDGGEEGITLRGDGGGARTVSGEALASVFALFRDTVKCVVLSSSRSGAQARAIRRHVPYVVGMAAGVSDPTALAFSAGFYKAVAAGRDVPFAFRMGVARVHAEGQGEEDRFVLL